MDAQDNIIFKTTDNIRLTYDITPVESRELYIKHLKKLHKLFIQKQHSLCMSSKFCLLTHAKSNPCIVYIPAISIH